jgi:methionyl-tRNA formyltransferase
VKQKYQIIFMGTPEFAVPSLKALHESHHHIRLVVTQPDRPKGRGRNVIPPPIKTLASNLNLPIIQPQSLKTKEFEDLVTSLKPDFIVVVAYGQILTENILSFPCLGTINVHASLLPKYRGPAPINWAIINGEHETGVTTMLMEKELDTGDILLTAKEPITAQDTAQALHDRLAAIGAKLLVKTIEAFANDTISPTPQDHSKATYAPLLNKSNGQLDWKKPAKTLELFIRGMTPWPGTFTFHENNRLKIYKAIPVSKNFQESPGTVLESFPDELEIATGDNALSILEIQGPSGKRLAIKDFLHGYKLQPGAMLK